MFSSSLITPLTSAVRSAELLSWSTPTCWGLFTFKMSLQPTRGRAAMRGRTISSVVRSSASAWNAPSEEHSDSRRQPARLRDGRIVRALERIWVRVERHLGITRALVPRRQPEIPTRQRDAPAASAEGTAPAGRYDVADGDLAQLEEVGRHDVGDGLLA